jgi:hypothetical protein
MLLLKKRVEYPVRPFPRIFKTNIIYDVLFFTMFTIRGFVGLLKKLDKLKGNLNN